MNQIPNPFLTGDETSHNAVPFSKAPPCAPSPGFLLMTRPASSVKCNSVRQTNTSNFNCSTSSNSSFPSWSSPTGFQNYRTSSPRNQSRGKYSGNSNFSRDFSTFENNSQKFNYRHQPSYQSPDIRNHSPSYHQSTPAGNCYGQGKNQNWRNSSPYKKSFHQNISHKTPLKEIPVEKFISRNVMGNPWNDFEEVINSTISNISSDNNRQSPVSSLLQFSNLTATETN